MLRYICDICGTEASKVFCHTDSTYLCSACDDFIHAEANPMAGHHFRVPIHTIEPSSTSAAAAASDEFFYYESDTGDCFDDLITLTSSRCDDVLQTSCGSQQGSQQNCNIMNVPFMHSLELNQSIRATRPWMKHPEVSTIQASSVCTPQDIQTVPESVSYIRPETHTIQHQNAKTAECLIQPSSENPISRDERVQRFREKRRAQNASIKIRFPSKKAIAASVRPRINGKFARRNFDKNVESK